MANRRNGKVQQYAILTDVQTQTVTEPQENDIIQDATGATAHFDASSIAPASTDVLVDGYLDSLAPGASVGRWIVDTPIKEKLFALADNPEIPNGNGTTLDVTVTGAIRHFKSSATVVNKKDLQNTNKLLISWVEVSAPDTVTVSILNIGDDIAAAVAQLQIEYTLLK